MSGWFDVIITDRAMPEMGGDQLAAAAARLAPDKPRTQAMADQRPSG
jgi:CheY-like chemotaxis protein